MFGCCGKVTSDFIISKHCAVWSTKGDTILQRCADQILGQEKPAQMFADTTSYTGCGWYQQEKAASVGVLVKLLRRQQNARNFPALCGLCTFGYFLFFLRVPLAKKWPIAHISGRESINAWQVDNDPSSKYSPSTHSVCGKKSHTFTV